MDNHVGSTTASSHHPSVMGDRHTHWLRIFILAFVLITLAACGRDRSESSVWTPVPTWTPTPMGAAPPAEPVQQAGEAQPAQAVQPLAVVAAPTATPIPPATNTPLPTPTPAPTATPLPTETPTPPPPPTDTPTPEPTPTPVYAFELEAAEKFPTDSLAPNVVRVYLYVYAPDEFGLPGYTMRVLHNGSPLPVSGTSVGGVPEQTRPDPGPYTRFTNMNVIFVEPQTGEWTIELLDGQGVAVGPPATFNLTADEDTRELYLRYKRK